MGGSLEGGLYRNKGPLSRAECGLNSHIACRQGLYMKFIVFFSFKKNSCDTQKAPTRYPSVSADRLFENINACRGGKLCFWKACWHITLGTAMCNNTTKMVQVFKKIWKRLGWEGWSSCRPWLQRACWWIWNLMYIVWNFQLQDSLSLL